VVGTRRTRCDRLGGPDRVSQHARRRNPQHPVPVLFQKSRPLVIARGRIAHVMRDAIDFDDHPFRETTKVDDVGADRMLSSKLQTLGAKPQLLPQQALRNR
jgi:hypothetical protein